MSRQTLIPVNAESESSFDSFCVGNNTELLTEIHRIVEGVQSRRVLYFWGEAGTGKTHLLNACCQLARTLARPHAYLPLDGLDLDQSGIDGIEPRALVCFDDLQTIAGNTSAQAIVFNLYEKLINRSGTIIVSANQAIGWLGLELKDLESRLASGGIYRLARLQEQDQLGALKSRARDKGINLNDQVLKFIITHYQRDTASLFSLLDRIDNVSLVEQRKITVPFIKSLL